MNPTHTCDQPARSPLCRGVTLLLVFCILCALTVIVGCSKSVDPDDNTGSGADPGPVVDSVIPFFTFSGPDQYGQIRTQEEWLGQGPVIFDFWASYCGWCHKQTPELDSIYRVYRDSGLSVVGLNAYDSSDYALQYAQQHGIDFPLVYVDVETCRQCGITGIPTLILADADGRRVLTLYGYKTYSQLAPIVHTLLEMKGDGGASPDLRSSTVNTR